MKQATKLLSRFFIVFFLFMLSAGWPANSFSSDRFALVIHGGSGNINPESMDQERRDQYLSQMAEALKIGEEMLLDGESSLDVVEAVVRMLEDSPIFNAGKGAVFNIEGKNELDASIMCGASLNAGAVTGVTTIRNPVSAARVVMEKSPHVFLSGKGAETFAFENGIEIVDPGYFFDQRRWEQYRQFVRDNVHRSRGYIDENLKMGTVGAVALDKDGNIAAATSTGGRVGKAIGRIGDSPVIGAGNYANNNACGVSATGHGEYFIRNMVAYDIAARIMYKDQSLTDAAHDVIHGNIDGIGAYGGIIAIDRDGNVVMEFNSTAMFRGFVTSEGERGVWIFRD